MVATEFVRHSFYSEVDASEAEIESISSDALKLLDGWVPFSADVDIVHPRSHVPVRVLFQDETLYYGLYLGTEPRGNLVVFTDGDIELCSDDVVEYPKGVSSLHVCVV